MAEHRLKMQRRRALRVIGLAAAGWLIAACGGSNKASTSTPNSADAQVAGAVPPTPALPNPGPRTATPLPQPTATMPPAPTVTPASTTAARLMNDVIYGTGGGEPLKLDLYFSAANLQPAPVVIFCHAGSQAGGGDKRTVAKTSELMELMARGYVVAAISYRQDDTPVIPNPIQDAKAAVRFLRVRAAQYGLAADRIGVWGQSFGAYLASMLGLTSEAVASRRAVAIPAYQAESRVQ